jgi:hypothetical protein
LIVQPFLHLTTAEIGHGLIALVVLAAALPVAISVLILLVLGMRMVRARLGRIRRRHIAQAGRRVDAQVVNLASQRAG